MDPRGKDGRSLEYQRYEHNAAGGAQGGPPDTNPPPAGVDTNGGQPDGKSAAILALGGDGHAEVSRPAANAFQSRLAFHADILVEYTGAMGGVQFPDGGLDDPAVPNVQLPRADGLSEPLGPMGLVADAGPGLHPGGHDPAAVGRLEGLGGIEVDALVHQLDVFADKAMVHRVIAANQGDHAVPVVELVPGLHLHRANHQHLLAVQLKEVGALPHDTVFAAAGVQNGDVFPVETVGAVEQQGCAAFRFALPDQHGGIAAVRLLPDLGVAEIKAAEAVGQVMLVQYRGREGLFVIEAVPHRDALGLHLARLAVRLRLFAHAGVEQQLPAVGQLGRRPREAAVLVGGAVGGDGAKAILHSLT